MAHIEFTDNSKVVLSAVDSAKQRALTMFGVKWQELVTKKITDLGAVDTGRMRSDAHYQVEPHNDQTIVGFSVEYAPFVDQGTYKMPARPFMKPTTIDSRHEYEQIVRSVFGNA